MTSHLDEDSPALQYSSNPTVKAIPPLILFLAAAAAAVAVAVVVVVAVAVAVPFILLDPKPLPCTHPDA